ncbi:unnamed protein product [Sphagnum jensenii]
MAVFYTRVNLNSAIFPFYTEAAGRTIIVPEYDENWDRNNAANTSPEKGVPQVYYMHNIMPKAGGFQSIGYNLTIGAYGAGQSTNFDQVFSLQSTDGSIVLFCPAAGTNYIYDAQAGNTWISISPISSGSITSQTIVTSATVNGQTYYCYAGYGTYIYNTSTKLMVKQTLISLSDATILGVTASNGYMIAWTKTGIVWSSLINPLDFTPSIQTGAGGGSVQQARGNVHRFYCQSTENVAFGALTNLYNYDGNLCCRTADATDTTKPAFGFCSNSSGIPSGQIGEVCLLDGMIIDAYSSNLSVGSIYYLAVGDGGGITLTPPSGTAQVAYPGHVYTKAPDGSVQDQSTPQQNQVLSTVAISANTNTAVYTPTNTPPYPRVVRIIPLLSSGGSNTTCAMNDTPGAATATSTPIPGGYVYNLTEPSPSNVVDLYCTTGGYVSVEVGY